MKTLTTARTANNFAQTTFATLLVAGLAGCGLGTGVSTPPSPVSPIGSASLRGTVFGGQQMIGGSTISLYAASQTGYGTASTQIGPSVVSASGTGAFNLSASANASGCTAGALVYAVSVGGNTGAGTNANSTLMALLGPCSAASASYPHFVIDESTTVAAVWALAPFMTDYLHVATSATNIAGLTEAFANATQLVNIVTGASPGINLPAGTTVPQATIYTLADILAACVNSSGGNASSSTNCGTLFTNANVGTAPTDTIKAALIMAQNPALTATKIANLFPLVSPTSPFQIPLSAAPNDLTLAVNYAPGTLSSPSALAIDASGQVWMTNTGGSANTVTVLSNAGVVNTAITGSSSSINVPSAIAIDAGGNAWIADKVGNQVSVVTASGANGTNAPFGGGGLSTPTGIAIDNQGSVWVSNLGTTSVTKINGTTVSEYTPAGATGPIAIAINPH